MSSINVLETHIVRTQSPRAMVHRMGNTGEPGILFFSEISRITGAKRQPGYRPPYWFVNISFVYAVSH